MQVQPFLTSRPGRWFGPRRKSADGRRYNAAMTTFMTADIQFAVAAPARPSTVSPIDLPIGLTGIDADRIAAAIRAARTESTQTVYAHAWRVWERWCLARGIPALPGDPVALCAYLAERAESGIAMSTLDGACTAIRHVHRMCAADDPVAAEAVRQVRLGLRRTYGSAPRRLARRAWRSPRDVVHPDLGQLSQPPTSVRARRGQDAPCPSRSRWARRHPDHSPLAPGRPRHATTAALAGVPLDRIAAQTRHRDISVLINRYIRPLEARTSSRDLGLLLGVALFDGGGVISGDDDGFLGAVLI